MARFRSDLQQAKTIIPASNNVVVQPGNEIAKVGQGRNGVVFLHIFKAPTTGTPKFFIDTAADPALGDNAPTVDALTGSLWTTAASGQSLSSSSAGVVRFTITDLGDVIRWRVNGTFTGEITFSCVVFLTDQ